MPTPPPAMRPLLAPFAPHFARRVWPHAPVLLVGTILAPGRRTVAAALRAMGLDRRAGFERYHRVLNRARWSGLAVSRTLLGLLGAAFVPDGPLVVGIDETVERRRGAKLAAKGIDRDAVRSSHSHVVKASGLRWVCLMLLVPVPWAGRVWALPFLTALAPAERYNRDRGRRHKAPTDWAGQLLLVVRRWWPDRPIVAVADAPYAAIDLLARCRAVRRPVTVVTRLRLDAALYAPAPPRRPHQNGRPRVNGARLPTLAATAADPATEWAPATVANWYGRGPRAVEVATDTAVWYHSGQPPVPLRWVLVRDPAGAFDPQALLCTDQDAAPAQILGWFVPRWQLRGHLRGGAPPPRGRNPAPVVRAGDPARAAGAAGPVRAGDAGGPPAHGCRRPRPAGRLVSQTAPHVRGRTRLGAAGIVGVREFLHVPRQGGHGRRAPRGARALDRRALLRGLNGQSRAKSVYQNPAAAADARLMEVAEWIGGFWNAVPPPPGAHGPRLAQGWPVPGLTVTASPRRAATAATVFGERTGPSQHRGGSGRVAIARQCGGVSPAVGTT